MTVSTEVNQAAYTGNGVTTVFPYTFRILNANNLTVTRIDLLEVETVLTLGTDYAVTGSGSYNGGAVVLTQPLRSGYSLVIVRDLDIVQETDLRNQGTFFAEVHEDAFDYLTMIIQQVASWFGLALRRPTIKSKFYDAKQYRIANMADPTGDQDAVNNRSMRSYVEKMIAGVVGGFGWFIQSGTGAVQRTFQDKMREIKTTADYGAKGDGVTNDSLAFGYMENLSSNTIIYGLGLVYVVDTLPTIGRYSDGWWLISGSLIPFDYISVFRANNKIIAIGDNAGASVAGARNCIAIGQDAMRYNVFGRHNICLGISAGMFLNGLNPSSIEGSRNLLIGGNSGRFMTTANRNIVLGRDAGHNITTGSLNIIIGNGAVMGDGPNTLDPGVIENQTPLTPSYATMIGTEAGKYFNSGYSVGVGYNAAQNTKSDAGLVAIGPLAFRDYQTDVSYWGTTQILVNGTGTYSQTGGKTITILSTAHGLTTGYRVLLRFTTGPNGDTTFNDDNWFIVTVVDANTFTIQSPVNATASGNMTFSKVSTTTPYTGLFGGCVGIGREVGNGVSNYRSVGIGDRTGALGLGVENVSIGYQVHNAAVPGAGNTAVGAYSQTKTTGGGNASLGVLTLNALTTGTNNTAGGSQSLRFLTTGSNNSGFGSGSLRGVTTGGTNTGVGVDSGRFTIAGADANYTNTTTLGFNAKVSGDNQAQIGDVNTTVYTQSAVQTRSDGRDKRNIRDTELGIEFILGLRPVQYNSNPREAYYEEHQEQVGVDEYGEPAFETRLVFNEVAYHAGEKAGGRDHQGLISQEVDRLAQAMQTDFAGLHNHTRNGGDDVLSLGYQQLDAPMIKTMHQLFEVIELFIDEPEKAKERIKQIRAAVPIIAPYVE